MTNLSALLAGFAMASFLQFGFDDGTVHIGVLIAFGLTTSVVVRRRLFFPTTNLQMVQEHCLLP